MSQKPKSATNSQSKPEEVPPLLIKAGLVFSESIPLSELLCKPKLLPIRGIALERLQELDEKIIEQRRIAGEDALAASRFGSDPNLGARGSNENSGGNSNALQGGGSGSLGAGGIASGGSERRASVSHNNNDVPLIAETFVEKIEDFSQFR
jgi:hypothetical protein